MRVDWATISALATAAGTLVLAVEAEAENGVIYLTASPRNVGSGIGGRGPARSTGPSGPTMRRLIAR